MDCLLSEDSYDTLPGKHDFVSKCLFNSYFYFFLRICMNYYALGKCAKKGRFTRERQVHYCDRNIRIMEGFGAQFHVKGLNHINAEDGPYVIIGNHVSSIETAILNSMISPRLDFTYVIKRSLFTVPFLGPAMSAVDAIGVDRRNTRDDFNIIMEEGVRRLTRGCSVLIFPESTRQPEFLPERFNSIGVKLALKANVKILPFALKTHLMKPGMLSSEFGPILPDSHLFFEFGKPVPITGNGKKEHRLITDFITEKTEEWKQHCIRHRIINRSGRSR